MRFVMGDAFRGNDKDASGRPRFTKDGQPKTTWFIGGIIAKNDPAFAEFWQTLTAVAQRDFPGGEYQRPDFAWKVVDGDGTNQDGKAYPAHCHGHYIVRMSNGYQPTVYDTANQQIVDPQQCQRGYYIRAALTVVGNGDAQRPGLYLNPNLIQVVGYGEIITSGPDPSQVFASPVQLPPGASATPVASAPMPAQVGMPPMGAPAAAPANPTAPVAQAPAQPAPAALPGNPTASPTNQPAAAPYPQILNGPTG